MESSQPVPRDSQDNGVVAMLVEKSKKFLHQYGGDDIIGCVRDLIYSLTY